MDCRPDHHHKVENMIALGRIATRHRTFFARLLRGRPTRKPARKRAALALESLEKIELLSRPGIPIPAADVMQVTASSVQINGVMKETGTQVTQTQSASVPNTLTNFSLPFAPPIALFNPSLGTLLDVKVTSSATLTSQIKSENTSTTTGADITGFTTGTFVIAGLPSPFTGNLNGTTATVSVPPFAGGPIDFTGPSSVTFPPLTTSKTQNNTFTSAADLAFFTATPGHTSISPLLVMSAQAGATAPNGNLQTEVTTQGSGQITVVYDYMPSCPAVVKLVRFGIHHQPTQLQLTFAGPVNPTDLANTANYLVKVPNSNGSFTGPGVTFVPIVLASPSADGTTVTLVTARQLNVHHHYQLLIKLPCNNGNTVVVTFGGKASLGGFLNPHTGQFVTVVNGKVVPF
jgi:hypothetical protein